MQQFVQAKVEGGERSWSSLYRRGLKGEIRIDHGKEASKYCKYC
jgi:hypothetical protein